MDRIGRLQPCAGGAMTSCDGFRGEKLVFAGDFHFRLLNCAHSIPLGVIS